MLNLDCKYFRGRALPEVIPKDFEELRGKYVAIGVIAALIRRSESALELLMLRHKPSEKVTTGTWGPLGEIVQAVYFEGRPARIESLKETLERGIREELEPFEASIPLPYLGYFFSEREVVPGGGMALAICPVIDCGLEDWFSTHPDTREIAETRFMSTEDALSMDPGVLRPQTHRFARELMEFMSPPPMSKFIRLQFEEPGKVFGYEDLVLQR
ncbi:MAG: hypothetical protein WD883_01110 [Candidatus Colwellbacteria bacterium]